jgi:REP element-mobilizing transposase RayT
MPPPLQSGSLPVIVRSFKSAVTREANRLRNAPGDVLWQGRYYEHIVCNAADLARIRRYIEANPGCWRG